MPKAHQTLREHEAKIAGALKRFVERVRARWSVEAVVLFGSRARGQHLRDTDVDLLVVSDAFIGQTNVARIEALLEYWDGPAAVEPFGATLDELKALRWGLLWDVLEDGRVLFDTGVFAQARERFNAVKRKGFLERIVRADGAVSWRFDTDWYHSLLQEKA